MTNVAMQQKTSPSEPARNPAAAVEASPEPPGFAGWPLELEGVFRSAAAVIWEITEFDTLAILLRGETGELRFSYAEGFNEEVVGNWRFGQGQGIVGTVVRTGEPVLVENVSRDPRYIAAAPGVLSEIALPLGSADRLIGVLDLGSHSQGFFDPELISRLTPLARVLARAIDNARRFQIVREQAKALSVLYQLAREVSSVLDKEALLEHIARQVRRVVDYQIFSLLLWNEETQELEHEFSLSYDKRFRVKSGLPLGQGLCGTAAALRQPVRVPDVELDPRYVHSDQNVKVRSELVVPLLLEDRLIGVLDVESVHTNAFSQEMERMLVTLGSYIAIALENARLFGMVREDEKRLEKDLTTAREVQKALLPDVPTIPGLEIAVGAEPALQLGGDFYDFLLRGDGSFALAVGDVAGKATPAALCGFLAIGLLRAHMLQECCDPASVLSLVDEHLIDSNLDNRFVAMILGFFDPASGTISLSNSGLPLPLLVRDGGVTEIDSSGRPLGLLPGSVYTSTEVELQSGDVLVLLSDGLIEAPGRDGTEFGLGRIKELLARVASHSAQDIVEQLMQANQRFVADNLDQVDDRTLLVVRVV